MRITLASVFVDDQQAALAFYTDVLGFVEHFNIPMGEFSWITVVSSENPDGAQLLLEPSSHPAVKPYRDALREDGISSVQFEVDDVHAEYDRLVAAGVNFTATPMEAGPVTMAVFDDTCVNYVTITSPAPQPEG